MSSSTATLNSIRRILCLENGSEARSPYVLESQIQHDKKKLSAGDFRKYLSPPPLEARRPIPSHIELCKTLLERKAIKDVEPEVEFDLLHVIEDEAVCTDWRSPFVSSMQIFASEVVAKTAAHYKATYSHDCQKTRMKDTDDGLDWRTFQQEFSASGLVLDDGSVTEEEIVQLCKGCLAGFNADEALASVDADHPNPSWFNPHASKDCIMYPGIERSLVNDQNEVDMAALQEQRRRAQQAPLGKLHKTIEDRLRLTAAKHKFEHGPAFRLANGRSVEDEEEEDGVIIYIDEGSMPMEPLQIQKHIPEDTNVISIIIDAACMDVQWENDETCYDYAQRLKTALINFNPNAEITFEVSASSAATFPRMTRVKTLICPPGTTGCLLPAMSKEEETFAVVAESMGRSNTEEFFDFVSMPRYNLQIANIDSDREAALDMGRNGDSTDFNLEHEVGAFYSSGSDYVDGCVEMRGRIGEWEKDFIYEDLATERNGLLRGSSAEDTVPTEPNQRSRANSGKKDATDLFKGNFRAWADAHPECDLDVMNSQGLCEIVHVMKLGVVQFVGDKYTEEMVKSFWGLLGIDDGDIGEEAAPSFDPHTQTAIPGKYRKTMHCPEQKMSFDIVFTPNENIADMDAAPDYIGSTHKIHYVPVATPVVRNPVRPNPVAVYSPDITRTGLYQGSGVQFAHDTYGGNGGAMGYSAAVGGSCWGNPYGNGCGCDNAATMRSAVPPPPPPPPQFNPACHCVPFQQQYQYNYATAAQAAQPMQRVAQAADILPGNNNLPVMAADTNTATTYQPLSGRQVIVGGISPDQSYDKFVQSVDQFGRTLTNGVDSNDIVIVRTAAAVPHSYGGIRRTQKSDAMTQSEIEQANNYLHRAVHEYRRRTRQSDLLSYDPAKSKLPYVHVLDVEHMTHTHPLATGRSDVKNVPDLYDHWNHLLYTNLRDIARAELARNSSKMKVKQQSAPPGSPYENDVPLFPLN